MLSRRQFLGGGLAAIAVWLLPKSNPPACDIEPCSPVNERTQEADASEGMVWCTGYAGESWSVLYQGDVWELVGVGVATKEFRGLDELINTGFGAG